MIEILYAKLDERAIKPIRAYDGDAGWDLHVLEDTFVPVGVPTDVRTGIAVSIPWGYYGRIVHRSSAPRKKGVMVLEGTIDAGFRGELFALAYVWKDTDVTVKAGDSICQLIVQPVPHQKMVHVAGLPPSQRGTAGFGSSGR